MTIKQLKDHLSVTDLDFVYKGKPYGVCPVGDMTEFVACDKKYKNLDDLLDNFIVDGKPFKDVLSDIDW